MQAYGTDGFWREHLEKAAGPTALMQAAAPLSFMGLMEHERGRERHQALEAQVLSELFRRVEAERMAATQQAFKGRGAMLSDEGNASQQLRQMQVYQAMMGLMNKQGSSLAAMRRELEKDAGLGQVAGQALGGFAKSFGGLGRRLAGTATQRAAGTAGPLSNLGMNMRQAGVGMQQKAQQWTRHGTGATARLQQAAAKQGVTAPRMPGQGGPYRTAAPAPTPVPARVPAAAPVQQAGQGGGNALRSIRNKALLYGGGGAVLAGTGYAGYKGLQATKDYMMRPTYASNAWGGQGMMPSSMPNEYGYQDTFY
jgi:hypothetical protein